MKITDLGVRGAISALDQALDSRERYQRMADEAHEKSTALKNHLASLLRKDEDLRQAAEKCGIQSISDRLYRLSPYGNLEVGTFDYPMTLANLPQEPYTSLDDLVIDEDRRDG